MPGTVEDEHTIAWLNDVQQVHMDTHVALVPLREQFSPGVVIFFAEVGEQGISGASGIRGAGAGRTRRPYERALIIDGGARGTRGKTRATGFAVLRLS
jgi:hypothetical protein